MNSHQRGDGAVERVAAVVKEQAQRRGALGAARLLAVKVVDRLCTVKCATRPEAAWMPGANNALHTRTW